MLAAHRDDLATHVGRVVTGQEYDHVGDLPGLGAATEEFAPAKHGEVFVGDRAVEKGVFGEAGRDRVDPDAEGRCFGGGERVRAMTPALAAA